MTTGDFDGNGYPDLAIGHPGEDTDTGKEDAGAVTVIFSTESGLDSSDRQVLTQGDVDKEEANDDFGRSLAAADFNNDGFDDLAVSAPSEEHERRFRLDYYAAGQVSVFYGSASRLRATSNSNWHQGIRGVASKRYKFEYFGDELETGDFNHDGFADLAISVPGEDVTLSNGSKQNDAGIIHILYGQNAGLSTNRALGRQVYSEPTRTVGNTAGRAEFGDGFGGSPIEGFAR